jgi:hypothetical protein
MNIHELDSYNLGDAVKFNDRLNPRIWSADEKMRPEVREQLLRIADDFREFLGIDVEVKDITVSGSNAAYTYTPHSDIDLHLVVDLPRADKSEVYRELFDAKKYAYNDMHDIKIGDYDVELYVQDANKPHISQGIYSVINNDWVSVPKRRRPDVNDISIKSKFEDLGYRIESAIASKDYKKISALADKIKEMRQAGLDAHGEFGPENLAFKILRKQGLIEKLYAARNAAKDELLSLDERRKKKKKKVRYGYGGYWYPGTAYAGQDHPAGTEGGDGSGDGGESMREDAGMTWDGVNPTTDMFTSEDATMTWDGVNPSTAMFTTETEDKSDEEILKDFTDFCVKELKIEHMPRVRLRRDPQWPAVHKTFGRYNDEAKTLEVAWGQRHIMDVLRTVAHELTHKHQHEREGERMGPDAGETGSPYENEANARAGVLMRDYGRLHPEYFSVGQAHDLEESASGYIPTKAQAKDPRYSMALTVDIRPGQVGKEANKLKLKTDRQGHPQTANPNGLFEQLMREYESVKEKKLFALADEAIQAPVSKEQRAADDYYRFIVGKIRLGRVLNRQEQEFFKTYNLKKKLAEDEQDLNELALKSTLPVSQAMNHPDKQVYDLKTQSGEYKIVFTIFNKDENFEDDPDYDGPTGLLLDILLLGQDSDGSWTQRNTNVGEKQVAQIFATIAQLGVKIIKSRPEINEIEITGADPQRSRIYSRLMQQNINSMLPGWKLGGDGLVREQPRQAVAEDKMSQINLDQKLARTPAAWQRFVKGLPPQLAQEFVDERPQPDQEDIAYFTPLSLTSHEPVYVKTADLLRHPENQGNISRSPDDVIAAVNQRWGTQIPSGKKYDPNPGRYRKYSQMRAPMASPSVMVDGVIVLGVGRFVAAALRGDDRMRVWSMTRKQTVKEDQQVSTTQILDYIRKHHDPNLHKDYTDYIENTFSGFELKNVPVASIKTDLPKLDTDKVAKYKTMDFSKAPPIVIGDGYILDGYHRANVAKALGIATIPAYVGVKNMTEDEDLDEVKMSPGALEKFATSDAAKGIRAGFEAELIFRDTQGESEELDPEPNYDADERAYSIS